MIYEFIYKILITINNLRISYRLNTVHNIDKWQKAINIILTSEGNI